MSAKPSTCRLGGPAPSGPFPALLRNSEPTELLPRDLERLGEIGSHTTPPCHAHSTPGYPWQGSDTPLLFLLPVTAAPGGRLMSPLLRCSGQPPPRGGLVPFQGDSFWKEGSLPPPPSPVGTLCPSQAWASWEGTLSPPTDLCPALAPPSRTRL